MALTTKAVAKSFPDAAKRVASSSESKVGGTTGIYGEIFSDGKYHPRGPEQGLELTDELSAVVEAVSKHNKSFHRLNQHPLRLPPPQREVVRMIRRKLSLRWMTREWL